MEFEWIFKTLEITRRTATFQTIHEELATVLGPKAPSYPTVVEWAKRLREGREDVNDDPRSGRPVSVLTDENIELVRQVINNDPHSTYDDIIAETSLSLTSRWIPHQLNDEQKQERVRLCRENLAKFRDGSWRLCDIITENRLKLVVKEIRKQRKSNGTKGIKLLHDNASPHRHSDVINYLTEEGINIIPHPPYSPDLALYDYWLNDYIKQNLTEKPDEKSLARAVS
ncbi:unnamed protein product [Rotaria socialis]|uniref:Transposase n=1 Tax=Rotaria socialis TaxID=392032 RepID=A0A821RS13_9BILA|nr:unnamed protein product [Rotaria socialis]